ncbi:hypothetical protein ABZ477_07995 [Microbacterium sp. NPDC019599]|uniref:hypothetical protein n=1 Tax=Microbacterium sp. NPDC019599 TaxID=3154690 RepID=UPI0033E4CB49
MSDTRDTLPTGGDANPAATWTPTGSTAPATTGAGSTPSTPAAGAMDTAKREASNVVGTAKDEAAGVVETAKEEAREVGREARTQFSRLYDQTRMELSDQAAGRQEKLAQGLRTAGQDLRGMADSSTDGGMAKDIVREVSYRLDGAASWLGSRDPGGVLDEVKRYARRRPIVFLAVAALAGVVVGRLTRAVAAGSPELESSRQYGQLPSGTGYDSMRTDYGTTGAAYGTTGTGYATRGYGSDGVTGAARPQSVGTDTDDPLYRAEERG